MVRPLPEVCSHIADAIDEIDSFIGEMTVDAFMNDRLRVRAVTYCILMITEAVQSIPDVERLRFPQIEWHAIRNLGNILRHQYDDVDPELIYAIARKDLGPLKQAVMAISQLRLPGGGA